MRYLVRQCIKGVQQCYSGQKDIKALLMSIKDFTEVAASKQTTNDLVAELEEE